MEKCFLHLMSGRSLFVLMQEIPVEVAGGGVFLREILRHLKKEWDVTAIFPAFPHQTEQASVTIQTLATEGIRGAGLPVTPDWGSLSFTLRRQSSCMPGLTVALRNEANWIEISRMVEAQKPDRWLLISPFAATYLPSDAAARDVCLYYMNVDEDVVVRQNGPWWRRFEGRVEKFRIRRFVRRVANRVGSQAAITQENARALTTLTGRKATHVLPVMGSRAVSRERVERGMALITTNYTYPHNRISLDWFLRDVWPLVGDEVRLEITGLDTADGQLAQTCAGAARVRYLGFLPKAELETCFERCALVVNPTISGSGFQIKLLDALARGVPAVSTLWSNPFGNECLSSDNPIELARMIETQGLSATASTFDYSTFHAKAQSQWREFLLGPVA